MYPIGVRPSVLRTLFRGSVSHDCSPICDLRFSFCHALVRTASKQAEFLVKSGFTRYQPVPLGMSHRETLRVNRSPTPRADCHA